jgi:hypothetical protein
MSDSDVLVVGDWYVDAHWVVAPHESDTASRRGEMHSLAVASPDSTVRALCGAGQVANILANAEHANGARRFGNVYGLGSWDWRDDPYIQALMTADNPGDNPFRLRSPIKAMKDSEFDRVRRVFNIQAAPDPGSGERPPTGTNRVIRIYRRSSADEYQLVERIDFETAPPKMWDFHKALDQLQGKPVGHILVKDHGHGVVRADLIRALARKFPHASWYVSTKRWDIVDGLASGDGADKKASWLAAVPPQRLRLLLFQQEAATRARTDEQLFPEVGQWTVEDGVPTRSALEALDGVANSFGGAAPVIVALPSRESLLARIPQSDRILGYISRGGAEEPYEAFMPRASALFAALFVAGQPTRRSSPGEPTWRLSVDAIKRALEFTAVWVQEEGARIVRPSWDGNTCVLDCRPRATHIVFMKKPATGPAEERVQRVAAKSADDFDWNHVRSEYRQAFSAWTREGSACGHGVIERAGGRRCLELWRAKSDVGGVISIVRAKRHMLRVLSRELGQFTRARKRVHKSFLIVDDPGWGKSTLVRELAASKRMRFLQLNIAELTRRTDLLAFFDTIVTTQAQDREMRLLVFVDEINALLENQSVYSSFLAPIDDGHYNRDGRSFTIEPCVWVFAGTDDLTPRGNGNESFTNAVVKDLEEFLGRPPGRPPEEGRESNQVSDQTDRSQKRSDFASRLTLAPFVLNRRFGYRERDIPLPHGVAAMALARELKKDDVQRKILRAWRSSRRPDDTAERQERAALKLVADGVLRPGRALERVYIGAEMMTRLHPSIQAISLRVLRGLTALPDTFTLRDLRHDLDNMVNVQRGVVQWKNMPPSFHRHFGEARIDGDTLALPDSDEQRTLEKLTDENEDDTMVEVRPRLVRGDRDWTGYGERQQARASAARPSRARAADRARSRR